MKTDIKTKWKNYVIKADAEKARYHKVVFGKDDLLETIRATGLKAGVNYTFSARVRMNIQQTECRKVLGVICNGWYGNTVAMDIAGKGDLDVPFTFTCTPPQRCGRKYDLVYHHSLHETRIQICSPRWGLLHLGACDGERRGEAASIHRPGIGRTPSEERRAA